MPDGDPGHVQLMLDAPDVGVAERVAAAMAAKLGRGLVDGAAEREGFAHALKG